MDLPNSIRRFDQHLGGPERVAQVATPAFQFGRQGAIENQDGIASEQRGEWIHERESGGLWGRGHFPANFDS